MYPSLIFVLVFLPPIATARGMFLYTCDPPCIHGSCSIASSDTETSSFCQCATFWYGDACSEFICDHPEANPCMNGATCQPLANYTDYECQCSVNYSGEFCTVSHFNCSNTTCSGHGNCSDNDLDPSGYQCECDVGFSGSNCEENIDDCVGVNCNNGTCVDGISRYHCSCNVNYTGSHCEDVDYCAIHSAERSHGCGRNGVCCFNGGTCVNMPDEERHGCTCPPPWLPTFSCLRRAMLCVDNPCHNGASCEDDGLVYTCTCPPGFSGSNCEENVDNCVGVNCNNGTCVDGMSSYYCSCNINYTGSHCEDVDYCAIHSAERSHGCGRNGVCCFNGGTCVNIPDEGRHECTCPPPWLPIFSCLRRTMLCVDNPCFTSATCEDDGLEYTCTCPPGLTGKRCDECADSNCQNGAMCSVTAGGQQHCQCLPYTTGEFCESRYDPCDSEECHNGGSCKSQSDGLGMVTSCICTDGYVGRYCERVYDPCDDNPCFNGGTCISSGNDFSCVCPNGFTGTTCSICSMEQFCDCPVPGCAEKANNEICDDECNNEQCHWDNDECRLIKTEDPWSQCTVMVDGKSCQDLFNNGVCDSECATTKCLLDGKDCLPVCPHRQCTSRFQNQKCNKRCNTQECLFDGGDCKLPTEVKLASGLLTFTIVLPEMGRVQSKEILRLEPFLVTLGGLLNCIPIIEDVREIGEPETTLALSRWNMTVVLDVGNCTDLCVSSSSEAKDILNIHYSRGSFPPYPFMVTNIYSQDRHKTV